MDFGPPRTPSYGAVNPDLLGKCTCNLGFSRMQVVSPDLRTDMHFKQNRTGRDGVLTAPSLGLDRDLNLEVKWSTILLQSNINRNKGSNPYYFRWEFGNIHPDVFDLLVLFGHHAVQATATDEDRALCVRNSDERVCWGSRSHRPHRLDAKHICLDSSKHGIPAGNKVNRAALLPGQHEGPLPTQSNGPRPQPWPGSGLGGRCSWHVHKVKRSYTVPATPSNCGKPLKLQLPSQGREGAWWPG